MSELAIKTRATHHVDFLTYSRVREQDKLGLDEFIQAKYKLPKRFELTECSNDSTLMIDAIKGYALKPHEIEELEDSLKAGNTPEYGLHLVIQDMCNKGWIPTGSYAVSVSW